MSKGLLEILLDNIFDSIFTPEYVGKYGGTANCQGIKIREILRAGRKDFKERLYYISKDNGET